MSASRPSSSGPSLGAKTTVPGRRPQAQQLPGLPSSLRSASASSSSAASTPASTSFPQISALPAHLLPRTRQDLSRNPVSPQPAFSSSLGASNQMSQPTGSGSNGLSRPMGKGTPSGKGLEKLSLPARTSKTGKKLVFLPEEVQNQPLPVIPGGARPLAHPPKADGQVEEGERDQGRVDDRSEAERMNKEERERNGFGRLTAYATAESYRLRNLAVFLKREHGAEVRIFDEAIYAVYTLPLLPGYGPNVRLRSSVAVKSPGGGSILNAMDKAEESGYQGSYFPIEPTDPEANPNPNPNSASTTDLTSLDQPEDTVLPDPSSPSGILALPSPSDSFPPVSTSPPLNRHSASRGGFDSSILTRSKQEPKLAEAIFFDYGVSVFIGFSEAREKDILSDCESGGSWIGAFGAEGESAEERGWEMEECHFVYDPTAAYPRIFNDLFTFKSPSHLLKLSLSHALAQSTKLSYYESAVQNTTAETAYIPKELALTGGLTIDRRDAVKLTGKLFKLKVEVNLVSNVLDTPELFWSEASLQPLYEAVREYLEIDGRVQVLNERLGVAGDLLDMIHEHVDNAGMHYVTWVIIWLIVVACLVEFGEVLARLVVKATEPELLMSGRTGIKLIGQKMISSTFK
ncbi:Uncharacterized conserved protein [Phaffia rhodozyma]|uniref:Uncharacterized conserved protein n=1 Tax=Phaffia rhodozyma TaxID=264483 RepID=A0A0F7SEL7_PHARH|nr:Uncharacterized conserved protein [Phaffia rhodozyma]